VHADDIKTGGSYGRPFSFVAVFLSAALDQSRGHTNPARVAQQVVTYVQPVRVLLQ